MDTVKIEVDSIIMEVPAGISVAAAVLGHKHNEDTSEVRAFFHNGMNASPRAPYCLMGVCYECMMEIDDNPSVQSCLVEVREGMKIKRKQKNAPFNFEDSLKQNEGDN